MFPARTRSRTPRMLALVAGAALLLAVGLWFGGHPSWLPAPLRSAFVHESATQKLEDQVYGLLTRDYYRPLSRTQLVNEGLQGAVASLEDPYSHYYDPANYHAFTDTTTDPQVQGGIGVGVAGYDHGLVISEVYPKTPAARAGLKPGDIIIGANGMSLAHRSESFAIARVKGRTGTYVSLRIRRGHAIHTVRVRRSDIAVPVASGHLLRYHGVKLGYVALSQFSEHAGAEVRAEVNKLRRAGARALILDLRDNGGGLLEQAVATASIFIPNGTIVSTAGRAQPRQVYFAKGDAIPTSIPLVVLANQDTASSAEIVTGALKVRGRATVVGTHTYGKGVFQEIEPLMNGGALDFTVGRYYLPNGHNLGGKGVSRGHGIVPDVYAAEPAHGHVDHQLQVAERVAASRLQ